MVDTVRNIFVFGSNLAGRHGRGAARYALLKHGAVYGVGEGLTGESYAIPTKDKFIQTRSIDDVAESITRFVYFANDNLNMLFFVTPIGTGLAGFSKLEISDIFYRLPLSKNIVFTKEWFQI